MRKRCLNMVHDLAQSNEKVVFIGSDLSPGLLSEMKNEFPERFFMEGICEANIFGMAAGLAMEGYMPFVNTIATFITRRAYEQIAVDICLHNLPVRMIGNGGGFVYAPLGPTHQAIEDIAAMRCLPNIAIVVVCDADEMTRLMKKSLSWPGPIYIRLGKGGEPIISDEKNGFEIGKAIPLREKKNPKITILTTGVLGKAALEAADMFEARGLVTNVVHHHTIKPLDKKSVVSSGKESSIIITLEEHVLDGGFGSSVGEALIDAQLPKMPRVFRFGIPNIFSENYGSQDELLAVFGLSASSIFAKVMPDF